MKAASQEEGSPSFSHGAYQNGFQCKTAKFPPMCCTEVGGKNQAIRQNQKLGCEISAEPDRGNLSGRHTRGWNTPLSLDGASPDYQGTWSGRKTTSVLDVEALLS